MAKTMIDTHSTFMGYLLWIFGFTGAHRFYYGKPISGTLYFFTLGLLFTPLYLHRQSLLPLGVAHGWLGVLAYYWLLGRDPWLELLG